MTVMIGQDTAEFIELLQQQRGLYERVEQAAERQAGLIAAGDTQGLLKVLEERKKLIDALGTVNQKLIPHREAWSRAVDDAPEADRVQVKGLLGQTQELLTRILRSDENDRKHLEERFGRLGQQVEKTQRAGQAAQAYGGRARPGIARYTDQKG